MQHRMQNYRLQTSNISMMSAPQWLQQRLQQQQELFRQNLRRRRSRNRTPQEGDFEDDEEQREQMEEEDKENQRRTELLSAYAAGDAAKLRQLLQQQQQAEAAAAPVQPDGQSLLHIGAADGAVWLLQLLLDEFEVDCDRRDASGSTALMRAVCSGKSQAVRYLLQMGADPDIPMANGDFPLHRACVLQEIRVLQLLLEYKGKVSTDVQDQQGNTALHRACLEDSVPHVKLLLDRVTEQTVNAVGYEKRTALHIAVQNQNRTCIQLLMQHGARVDICDFEGKTVIDCITMQNNAILVSDLAQFFTETIANSVNARSFHELLADKSFHNYLSFLNAIDCENCECTAAINDATAAADDSTNGHEDEYCMEKLLLQLFTDQKIDLVEFQEVILGLLETPKIHNLIDKREVLERLGANFLRYVLFRDDQHLLHQVAACGPVWRAVARLLESRIDEVYCHTPERGISGAVNHLRTNFVDNGQLQRESLVKHYGSACSLFRMQDKGPADTGNNTPQFLRHPLDSLAVWSVLTGKHQLTRTLLSQEQFDILPMSLFCAALHRQVGWELGTDADQVESLSADCERLAVEIVCRTYQLDASYKKQVTVQWLLTPLPQFADCSCMDIAGRNELALFLQTEAGQAALDKRWYRRLLQLPVILRELAIWLGVLPGNLLVPMLLVWFAERHRKAERRHQGQAGVSDKQLQQKQQQQQQIDGNCEFLLSNLVENNKQQQQQQQQQPASPKSSPERVALLSAEDDDQVKVTTVDNVTFKSRAIDFLQQMHAFYHIPAVKFRYHALSHVVLLLLLSYTILVDFEYRISLPEIIVYLILSGYLLEEVNELLQCHLDSSIWSYFRSKWNFIDLAALSCAIIGFCIRAFKVADAMETVDEMLYMIFSDHGWYIARVFLGISCTLYWIRLLFISTVLETLGPKLKMIGQMITKDLAPFLFILFIFILGFGILMYSLLFPNGYRAWNRSKLSVLDIFLGMFKLCFYSMVGDYSLDLIMGDDSCVDILNNETINDGSCPHCYGRYLVPYIILPLYVIITEILLLNLIIALFSKTVEDIDSRSRSLWQFERHDLIEEFESRSALPPPLNLLLMLGRLATAVCTRCCPRLLPQSFRIGTGGQVDQGSVLQFLLYQAFGLRNTRRHLCGMAPPAGSSAKARPGQVKARGKDVAHGDCEDHNNAGAAAAADDDDDDVMRIARLVARELRRSNSIPASRRRFPRDDSVGSFGALLEGIPPADDDHNGVHREDAVMQMREHE